MLFPFFLVGGGGGGGGIGVGFVILYMLFSYIFQVCFDLYVPLILFLFGSVGAPKAEALRIIIGVCIE